MAAPFACLVLLLLITSAISAPTFAGDAREASNSTCDRTTTASLCQPRDRLFSQNLGPRKFSQYIPSSYDDDASRPVPLMIYVHGQYGNSNMVGRELPFSAIASQPVISVYPQGVDDHATSDCGTGWNVGPMGHDGDNCNSASFEDSCCYESCYAQGLCGGDGEQASCGWSTCLDDEAFITGVISKVSEELCVDSTRIYLAGGSNGGMMVHYLYSKFPEKFAAVAPIYGLPLKGHIDVPDELVETSIFHMHDRSDTVIPEAGGFAGGWEYESADDVLKQWAELHGCEEETAKKMTPFDGGEYNVECVEHKKCKSKKEVVKCLYDGHHGDWPDRGELLLSLLKL